jgi:hypothetical protein
MGPLANPNARYDNTSAEHGPGMQVTFGAISILRFEKVCVAEHPLKLYPTVIEVTFSSGEMLNEIGLPCDVVPAHSPR